MQANQGFFGCWKIAAGAFALVLSAATHNAAIADTQVTDKWITVVTPGEPPSLDGCDSSRAFQGRIVKQNIVETLIEKNAEDGSLKPRLATSWEQIDPVTWRIKLRQGVIFHDGSPFNAAAVKKSLERTATPALSCGDRNKFFSDVTLVETTPIDDYTLQIKTSRPEPILPMRLAGTTVVGPNTLPDKLSLAPVGTGPYAFDSWQTGQQILLKRFDKYWGEKPEAEGARYIWRDESSVRAAMVNLGEADIAPIIAEHDATNPKTDSSYLNSETTYLRPDAAKPPLDDRRVRLAMNYALDRASMIGTVMPKAAVQASQLVMPAIPGHNHEIDKKFIPYDPAKARLLLAEAKADGVPVDSEITFITYPSQFPSAREVMDAIATMFKAAGLNIKMITVDPGQYAKWLNKPFADPRPPAILQTSHDNNFGDPVFSVFHRLGCEGNASIYCNAELDKETVRVSGLSGQERIAGWQNIFRNVYEDLVPVVFLYHMVGFARVNPRIDFKPDLTTNVEIHIQKIHFTK